MAQPIAVKDGQAFAFPNVCLTPVPGASPVPIPYPSIADLGGADDVSENVTVGGLGVILAETSSVASTSGDEAGTDGGVTSMTNGGKAEFPVGSGSVLINGKKVVRMGDTANMNVGDPGANAVGTVLSGDASVLVGG
ncbi:MAG: DUF4150 domain-containing protein [Pseudomonadota bacterium]